jgi:thioredoxin 1
MIFDVTDKTFNEKIASSHFVLVDFWAEWCGPCRKMHGVLEDIEKNFKDKILFCKLNIDQFPTIATHYKIMSIPTLILFVNGIPEETKVGYIDVDSLMQWLENYTSQH